MTTLHGLYDCDSWRAHSGRKTIVKQIGAKTPAKASMNEPLRKRVD